MSDWTDLYTKKLAIKRRVSSARGQAGTPAESLVLVVEEVRCRRQQAIGTEGVVSFGTHAVAEFDVFMDYDSDVAGIRPGDIAFLHENDEDIEYDILESQNICDHNEVVQLRLRRRVSSG